MRAQDAPIGSLRWQLGLLGYTLAGAAIAVCPVWWAVALRWDVVEKKVKKESARPRWPKGTVGHPEQGGLSRGV